MRLFAIAADTFTRRMRLIAVGCPTFTHRRRLFDGARTTKMRRVLHVGQQKSQGLNHSILGTQTRGRTGMEVNPLVFETSASTDSAIWAFVEDAANIGAFLRSRKPEGDGGRFGAGVTSFLTALCCTSQPGLWRGLRVCHRPGGRRTSFAPPTAWRHRRGRLTSAVR